MGQRARAGWLVCGAACLVPLAGCEALLDAGSLTQDVGDGGGGRDVTTSDGSGSGSGGRRDAETPDGSGTAGNKDAAARDAMGSGSDARADGGSDSGKDGASSDALGDVVTTDAPVGCSIAGVAYASGDVNPANACQSCQPARKTTDWSNLTDGTACGGGTEVCHAGACASGCEIASTYYAANAINPNDACETCTPAMTTSAWTVGADGSPCGNGQVCMGGACGSQCDIGGVFYASGAADPNSSCESCQPGKSTVSFTNLADGTSCGMGVMCNAGSCVECTAGQTQTDPVACGNCGSDIETCSNGNWKPGTCTGQGCAPGAMQPCNTYGTQSCSGACAWGVCSCPLAPNCTVGTAPTCSGGSLVTCDSCGQMKTMGCPNGPCANGVCEANCVTVVTSSIVNVQNPFGVSGAGSNCGAGTDVGGGGGGTTSLVTSDGDGQIAVGGAGGHPKNTTPATAGAQNSLPFTLSASGTLTIYVGGGGGGGGNGVCVGTGVANEGGGGGGSGYKSGGGGSSAGGGGGGTVVGGGAGASPGTNGAGAVGGNGGTGEFGYGANAGAGGMPGSGAELGAGGGGGGYGGGGGHGGSDCAPAGSVGGSNGATGAPVGCGAQVGLGASAWATATTFPAVAGAAGANATQGGNAGVVFLSYVSPTGVCSL
jgi:hypothetical protein